MPTSFSQRDPRWAKDKLGTCALTIGEAGCLISAVASMLVDFGAPTDPGRLNRWLNTHHGYLRGCQYIWDSVRGLGANLGALIHCPTQPAPIERIEAALASGCGVIAEVDSKPGGKVQQHWVRVLQVVEGECLIMDPWQRPGMEIVALLDYYGAPGWDSARAIFAVAIYTQSSERVIEFSYPDVRLMDAQGLPAIRAHSVRLDARGGGVLGIGRQGVTTPLPHPAVLDIIVA